MLCVYSCCRIHKLQRVVNKLVGIFVCWKLLDSPVCYPFIVVNACVGSTWGCMIGRRVAASLLRHTMHINILLANLEDCLQAEYVWLLFWALLSYGQVYPGQGCLLLSFCVDAHTRWDNQLQSWTCSIWTVISAIIKVTFWEGGFCHEWWTPPFILFALSNLKGGFQLLQPVGQQFKSWRVNITIQSSSALGNLTLQMWRVNSYLETEGWTWPFKASFMVSPFEGQNSPF